MIELGDQVVGVGEYGKLGIIALTHPWIVTTVTNPDPNGDVFISLNFSNQFYPSDCFRVIRKAAERPDLLPARLDLLNSQPG